MTFVDEHKTGHDLAQPEIQMTNRENEWLEAALKRGKREMFSEVVTVTPSIAAALLARNTHNRPYNQKRAEKYATMIADGRWMVTPESIIIDRNGVLADGQHRLGGVIISNTKAKMLMWFGADPEIFKVLNQGITRTAANITAIAGYSNSAIRSSIAGFIGRLQAENPLATLDTNKVLQIVEETADDDMEDAIHFGEMTRSRKLCNGTAAALAYWIIKKNSPNAARLPEFVDKFLTGANLSERSAVLRLRNMLTGSVINETNTRSRRMKEAAAIIMGWNAFLGGRYLNSIAWKHHIKLPEAK